MHVVFHTFATSNRQSLIFKAKSYGINYHYRNRFNDVFQRR
jgi:hypothetical protein